MKLLDKAAIGVVPKARCFTATSYRRSPEQNTVFWMLFLWVTYIFPKSVMQNFSGEQQNALRERVPAPCAFAETDSPKETGRVYV